jgi:hypothetical protein
VANTYKALRGSLRDRQLATLLRSVGVAGVQAKTFQGRKRSFCDLGQRCGRPHLTDRVTSSVRRVSEEKKD